jgi:hypothetical protein
MRVNDVDYPKITHAIMRLKVARTYDEIVAAVVIITPVLNGKIRASFRANKNRATNKKGETT